MLTSGMNMEMSIATRSYAGEKGYLDEDDKIIRKYDKDGDGKFTIDETKSTDSHSALLLKDLHQRSISVLLGSDLASARLVSVCVSIIFI